MNAIVIGWIQHRRVAQIATTLRGFTGPQMAAVCFAPFEQSILCAFKPLGGRPLGLNLRHVITSVQAKKENYSESSTIKFRSTLFVQVTWHTLHPRCVSG